MRACICLAALLGFTLLVLSTGPRPAPACCPAPPSGKPVVNADQTVIILWDEANKTQHFIRKASFMSASDDFGFIVPSPTVPELAESGNEAFPILMKITEPEVKKVSRPTNIGCGCSESLMLSPTNSAKRQVIVHAQKEVAGFNAAVLESKTADALVGWLKENGYAYSTEIENWAKPYVAHGWKFTALKIARNKDGTGTTISASALRISFKTDRPLFPYREPDTRSAADALGAKKRLLRIYFLAEARYKGEVDGSANWTSSKVAWTNKVSDTDRSRILEVLKLPTTTGPAKWWLTEFEDNWPYQVAAGDVYFSKDTNQIPVKRDPIIQYVGVSFPTDLAAFALVGVVILPPIYLRLRRWLRGSSLGNS